MSDLSAQDIRRGIGFLERIAVASERIATALEDANKADPMQMIERALSEAEDVPENLTASLAGNIALGPHDIPESERYRFR